MPLKRSAPYHLLLANLAQQSARLSKSTVEICAGEGRAQAGRRGAIWCGAEEPRSPTAEPLNRALKQSRPTPHGIAAPAAFPAATVGLPLAERPLPTPPTCQARCPAAAATPA